jgi:3-deoxy-D-manno-octulosonic-acid transferase
MADNYTQFSTLIPYQTQAQRDWLVMALDKAADSDEGAICQYEIEERESAIWVYAEEYGDVQRLADLVAEYQEEYVTVPPWILSWSETCSKMRLDEFGGGAVAVKGGQQKWFNPMLEAEQWLQQL